MLAMLNKPGRATHSCLTYQLRISEVRGSNIHADAITIMTVIKEKLACTWQSTAPWRHMGKWRNNSTYS